MRVNCLKFEKFARLSRPYPSSKPNEATTKRHCTRDFLSLDDFSFNDTLLFFKLRQLILVCNLSLLTQIPLFANSKINRLKTSMRKYLNLFSTCYFILFLLPAEAGIVLLPLCGSKNMYFSSISSLGIKFECSLRNSVNFA